MVKLCPLSVTVLFHIDHRFSDPPPLLSQLFRHCTCAFSEGAVESQRPVQAAHVHEHSRATRI